MPKWTEYVPGLSIIAGGGRVGVGVVKICTKNKTPLQKRTTFAARHQKWSGLSDVGRGFVIAVPVFGNATIAVYDILKEIYRRL